MLNNSAVVTTPVAQTADLVLKKTADRDTVDAGGVIDFALATRNAGPGIAGAAHVTDPVPAGTTSSAPTAAVRPPPTR